MASRTQRSRPDTSPYARPRKQAQPVKGGLLRYLGSLIWGGASNTDAAPDEIADEGLETSSSQSQGQAPLKQHSSPPARGWNNLSQDRLVQEVTTREEPMSPTRTLEDFFRQKREANESVTPEEAAEVVRLVSQAQHAVATPKHKSARASLASPVRSSSRLFWSRARLIPSAMRQARASSPFVRPLAIAPSDAPRLTSSMSMPSLSSKMFPSYPSNPSSGRPSLGNKSRNLYMGPGYSTQAILKRRQRLAPGAADLRSVKSEANLPQNKRRRTDDAEPIPATPSTPSSTQSFSFNGSQIIPTSTGAFALQGGLTGSRPKEMPTPKSSAVTSAQSELSTTPRRTTRAANIMLDIIKTTEEEQPLIAAPDILNPYDRVDSPTARIYETRSRKVAPTSKSTKRPMTKEALQKPAKRMSVKERMEKTMPIGYRSAIEHEEAHARLPKELLEKDTAKPSATTEIQKTKTAHTDETTSQIDNNSSTSQPTSRSAGKKSAPITIISSSEEETDVNDPVSSIPPSRAATPAVEKEKIPTGTAASSLPADVPSLLETHQKAVQSLPPSVSPDAAALEIPKSALPSFDFGIGKTGPRKYGSLEEAVLSMPAVLMPVIRLM